jgi:hypothetical protein
MGATERACGVPALAMRAMVEIAEEVGSADVSHLARPAPGPAYG